MRIGRSDEFRRRLGTDQQAEAETYLRAKAMENEWDIDVIDEVWQTVASFGSFGFCKATVRPLYSTLNQPGSNPPPGSLYGSRSEHDPACTLNASWSLKPAAWALKSCP